MNLFASQLKKTIKKAKKIQISLRRGGGEKTSIWSIRVAILSLNFFFGAYFSPLFIHTNELPLLSNFMIIELILIKFDSRKKRNFLKKILKICSIFFLYFSWWFVKCGQWSQLFFFEKFFSIKTKNYHPMMNSITTR